eukprot:TRINITY_DN3111_c0_g2_i1.p1 TRINITY_DN3111_c0_g2~~TRINITY_DN3111_c0_g2_i1.p1  ORF type:complete len:378 (-),score=54.47 TRINITY_DN3111_c0_g2_i1:445-1578(-)
MAFSVIPDIENPNMQEGTAGPMVVTEGDQKRFLDSDSNEEDSRSDSEFSHGTIVTMNQSQMIKENTQTVKKSKRSQPRIKVPKKQPLFSRFIAALRSEFTFRLFILVVGVVSVFSGSSSYYAFQGFEGYRSSTVALTIAVDLRFHIRECAVHTAAIYFEYNQFETKDDAISLGTWTSGHVLSQYRRLAFEDSTTEVRNDEINSLLYTSYCMIMDDEVAAEADMSCESTDSYPFRSYFYNGIDSGLRGFMRIFDKVLWFGEAGIETPFTMVNAMYCAGNYDLYDGFTRLINQLIDDIKDQRTLIDSNVLYISLVIVASILIDMVLMFVFVLQNLIVEIKRTRFFVQLLPSNVIESSPVIYYSCVNNEIEDDVDVAIML